jgi:DNA-binding MarR family transcriptional regulator
MANYAGHMSKRLTGREQEVWHAWKRAAEMVRMRVGADITAATGLSDGDFGVLTRLVDLGEGTLRQNELAESMGWHRSRLSHHLTRMEARGMVKRHSVDAGVQVRITAAGERAAAASRPAHAAAVRRHLLDLIPSEDRASLVQLLETIASGPDS